MHARLVALCMSMVIPPAIFKWWSTWSTFKILAASDYRKFHLCVLGKFRERVTGNGWHITLLVIFCYYADAAQFSRRPLPTPSTLEGTR